MTVAENERKATHVEVEPVDVVAARRQCLSDARRFDPTIRMIVNQAPVQSRSEIAAFALLFKEAKNEIRRINFADATAMNRCEVRQQLSGDAIPTPAIVALRDSSVTKELLTSIVDVLEEDHKRRRYATWGSLHDWAGRIGTSVVDTAHRLIVGKPAVPNSLGAALVLTRLLQNVRDDLLTRDHLYIPSEWTTSKDFEARLSQSAAIGHGVDQQILSESREAIKRCAERIWPLYMQAETFVVSTPEQARSFFEIALGAGVKMMRMIELWNYETALHRPSLTPTMRMSLRSQVWMRERGILARERADSA